MYNFAVNSAGVVTLAPKPIELFIERRFVVDPSGAITQQYNYEVKSI